MKECARIPSSTYRLQFNHLFTFRQAAEVVDYLDRLGISDCYASPLQAARRGSPHGYDITDHSRFNPEIGGEEEFIEFARRLKGRGMGLIMDVVPNHMCIAGSDNQWWNDVLENGPSSPYASFFDIDWQPPKDDLVNKVLLPLLGDQYGIVLENGELRLEYDQGSFFIAYYETRLPVSPRSFRDVLEPMLDLLRESAGEELEPVMIEIESIITAIRYLPSRLETDQPKIRERQREKEVIKRRIHDLIESNPQTRVALETILNRLNGRPGNPESFDCLEKMLDDQGYRLAFWRVASDEINYRRFFDINELASIRVEDQEVFSMVHELIFRLMRQGWVTGFRIDHVDGLFDPSQYFVDLQSGCRMSIAQRAAVGSPIKPPAPHPDRPAYLVAEKILGYDERLRPDWAVYGTTGYGFLNLLNGVFVDTRNRRAFNRIYERFTDRSENFADLAYNCKKLILQVAMSSELTVLARKLDRCSEQHRNTRDFTLNSLQDALSEVIACFPIYRTYTRPGQSAIDEEDERHIERAIRDAKRRNPALSHSHFDLIRSLLLLDDPPGLSPEQRTERRDFVLRFQQLTGPVTAKGLEDTAFYRYFPLASLNEVGGEPSRFGVTLEGFHQRNLLRMSERPDGMSATSTHDTKRSEDVRARINVLSEMPSDWYRAIMRWQELNRDKKSPVWDGDSPDANDEYLIYQTLVGIWPPGEPDPDRIAEVAERLQEYALKAIREAKIHTSWVTPQDEYERGVRQFINLLLEPDPDNRFLSEFLEFCRPVARAGALNSLSQTLLKICSPGVPDFYQGTETWNFSLVDPDNRRPVNYDALKGMLDEICGVESPDLPDFARRCLSRPEDGLIKMFVTRQVLLFRRQNHLLFSRGRYIPMRTAGRNRNQIITFARSDENKTVIVAAGRFFSRLGDTETLPLGAGVWHDTRIIVDRRTTAPAYRDVLTGETIRATVNGKKIELNMAEVFAHLPLALLEELTETVGESKRRNAVRRNAEHAEITEYTEKRKES